jgi:hypothetical protein
MVRSLWSWAHVRPLRQEDGIVTLSSADAEVVEEYVVAVKVTEPPRFSLTLNVDDGHDIARGFDAPLMHAFVKFHVPTRLPPHAVNDEQFPPPEPLVLPLEHPDARTHVASANSFQEICMARPPLRPPRVHHARACPPRAYCLVAATVIEFELPIIPGTVWMRRPLP